jgi:SAM-dependent methyltransferase
MSASGLDSRRRYAASAEHYHRHRPSYPGRLIDWIVDTTGIVPPARVADVGCGTGIATRLFAARGFPVVGIEPNLEMLAFAAERAGGARYLRGEAAATGLATGRMDLVVAAQSFHWFETGPALAEFGRILRPGGWCAAFWNLRAPTPFVDAYDALLRSYSAEYDVMLRQEAAPAALRSAHGVLRCREATFTNVQVLDFEGLLGRAYSSSCVRLGVRDPDAFERALALLFERHALGGQVEFRYRTVGLCWQLTGGPAQPGP